MKILALTLVIAMVFMIGCVQQPIPEFEGKDCGTNITCYQEAMAQCQPAKVETSQEINGITVTLYSHIQGGTAQECTIYQRIKDIEVPEDTKPEEMLVINAMKGADATCVGPIDKLGAGTIEEFEKYFECEGTLYELMKITAQAQQEQ